MSQFFDKEIVNGKIMWTRKICGAYPSRLENIVCTKSSHNNGRCKKHAKQGSMRINKEFLPSIKGKIILTPYTGELQFADDGSIKLIRESCKRCKKNFLKEGDEVCGHCRKRERNKKDEDEEEESFVIIEPEKEKIPNIKVKIPLSSEIELEDNVEDLSSSSSLPMRKKYQMEYSEPKKYFPKKSKLESTVERIDTIEYDIGAMKRDLKEMGGMVKEMHQMFVTTLRPYEKGRGSGTLVHKIHQLGENLRETDRDVRKIKMKVDRMSKEEKPKEVPAQKPHWELDFSSFYGKDNYQSTGFGSPGSNKGFGGI